MAQFQTAPQRNNKRRSHSSPQVDFTALVDLAFLLLSFFMLTTTLQKTTSMSIVLPPSGEPTTLKKGITFLMGANNRLYYYEGQFVADKNEARPATQLRELRYAPGFENSLSAFLTEKTETMLNQLKELEAKKNKGAVDNEEFQRLRRDIQTHKEHYAFLLKPGKEASYQNVVDVLDELNHFSVGKYSINDISSVEENLLNNPTLVSKAK